MIDMKNIKYMIAVLALASLCSCEDTDVQRNVNNDFTFESAAPQWKPAAQENGVDTLVFGWEAAEADINIIHDVTSNEWKVRCSLDDSWANYTPQEDVLTVSVKANITTEERQTYADVVVGENSRKIIVIQSFYPRNGSTLPDTSWDEDEVDWTGTK